MSHFTGRLEKIYRPSESTRLQPCASRRDFLAGLGAGLGAALVPDVAPALLPSQRAFLTAQAVDIIHVIAGQSNGFNGIAFNAALDLTQSNFFQIYFGHEGPANHISPGGANDPLDNTDVTGITNNAIGNAVHFYRDYFCPSYGARRVVFVPCVYGGTSIVNTTSGQWGVSAATGGAAIGGLTTGMISRFATVWKLFPSAKVVMSFELVEADSNATSWEGDGYWSRFRGGYLDWILYVRAQFAALGVPSNFPMILGRPTPYLLTTADTADGGNSGYNWIPQNVLFADGIMRGLVNRMQNIGIADSQNPTAATNQSASPVHFDAAGQRTMAGRYFTGYKNAVGNALYPTYPVWDTIDVMTSAAGFASGFTVGSGGSTLSGDSNGGWKTALATTPSQPSTSSTAYAEIVVHAIANGQNVMIGLCNQAFDLDTYLGASVTNTVKSDYSAACFWPYPTTARISNGSAGTWAFPGSALSCPAVSAGDVIQFAVNRATGYAWVGRNGTWLGSGNPATGTNPWLTGIPQTDMVFLAASIYTGAGNTFAINGKSSQFAYAPPGGFSAWGH